MGSWSLRHLSSWTGIIASFPLVLLQGIFICCILVFLLTRAGSHTASCSQISGTKLINSGEALMQIPSHLIPQLASTLHGIPSTDTVPHYQVTQHHQQPHIILAELGAASHTAQFWGEISILAQGPNKWHVVFKSLRALQSKKGSCFAKGNFSVGGFLVCWSVISYCIDWIMN